MVIIKSTLPGTSRGVFLSATLPVVSRLHPYSPSRQKGILSQKIQRQPMEDNIMPPTAGPRTGPKPIIIPNVPSAAPFLSGATSVVIRAAAVACSMAAPMPWSERERISCAREKEAPAAIELMANTSSPHRYIKMPMTITESPKGDNRGAECHQIDGYGPGNAGHTGVEIGHKRRKSHIDNAGIKGGQEHANTGNKNNQSLADI